MTMPVSTLPRIALVLLAVIVSQGVWLPAPDQLLAQAPCQQSKAFSMEFQDAEGRTLSPAVNTSAINSRKCLHYVEVGTSSKELRLVTRTSKKQRGIRTSSNKAVLRLADMNQDSTESVYEFNTTTETTLEVPLTIEFADTTPESPTIYLFRRPDISFEPRGDDCIEGQICVTPKQTSRVRISGSNLGEIDRQKGLLIDDRRADLIFHQGVLVAVIPASAFIKDASAKVTYYTRSRFVRNDAGTNDIVLAPVNVHLIVENDAIAFGEDGSTADTTLFVGESTIFRVHTQGENTLQNTYTVEEQTNQRERKVVAVLDVLRGGGSTNSKMVRMLGVAPTSAAVRRGESNVVFLYQGDTAVFHTHLRVVERPRIESWSIRHINSRYKDQLAHPGDTIQVVLKGKNLRDFERVAVDSSYGKVLSGGDSTGLVSDTERTVKMAVSIVDTDRVPLHLHSSVARDTTLFIPAQLAQAPRRLDFAKVRYQNLEVRPRLQRRFPFFAWRERDTTSVTVRPDSAVTYANSLAGVVVRFHPDTLDSNGAIHGVQYLVVDAALHSADGEKVDHDSVRVAVVPTRPGFTYRVQSGYAQNSEVHVDDLLDRLGRYSEPGSRLLVSIRHDSLRYAGDNGYPTTLQFVNSNRVRIRPYANLMTGVVYVARVRQADQRFAVQNGSGTDSIVRQSYRRETKLNTLSMLGSIAMEAAVLRTDGRPSFARLRLGLLALESPFDEQRRRRELGLSVLYPIELMSVKGGVSLSISAGGACLTSRECFGLVSPGFDIALGR